MGEFNFPMAGLFLPPGLFRGRPTVAPRVCLVSLSSPLWKFRSFSRRLSRPVFSDSDFGVSPSFSYVLVRMPYFFQRVFNPSPETLEFLFVLHLCSFFVFFSSLFEAFFFVGSVRSCFLLLYVPKLQLFFAMSPLNQKWFTSVPLFYLF